MPQSFVIHAHALVSHNPPRVPAFFSVLPGVPPADRRVSEQVPLHPRLPEQPDDRAVREADHHALVVPHTRAALGWWQCLMIDTFLGRELASINSGGGGGGGAVYLFGSFFVSNPRCSHIFARSRPRVVCKKTSRHTAQRESYG